MSVSHFFWNSAWERRILISGCPKSVSKRPETRKEQAQAATMQKEVGLKQEESMSRLPACKKSRPEKQEKLKQSDFCGQKVRLKQKNKVSLPRHNSE